MTLTGFRANRARGTTGGRFKLCFLPPFKKRQVTQSISLKGNTILYLNPSVELSWGWQDQSIVTQPDLPCVLHLRRFASLIKYDTSLHIQHDSQGNEIQYKDGIENCPTVASSMCSQLLSFWKVAKTFENSSRGDAVKFDNNGIILCIVF